MILKGFVEKILQNSVAKIINEVGEHMQLRGNSKAGDPHEHRQQFFSNFLSSLK